MVHLLALLLFVAAATPGQEAQARAAETRRHAARRCGTVPRCHAAAAPGTGGRRACTPACPAPARRSALADAPPGPCAVPPGSCQHSAAQFLRERMYSARA